jgi:SAM-dependent methyltransferase
MIETKCKNCNIGGGISLIDITTEKDTYLDYLSIDYSNIKREYIKCNNCGLIYRTIIMDEMEKELLYKHFRDESLRNETKEEYFERITSLPIKDSENYDKCQFLKRYIKNDANNKILDIGCGAGVFLYAFKNIFDKWNTIGVEPTKDFSDIAKDKGIHILNEYLDENTFDYTFDLISMNHVLEHLDNYFDMLNMLKKYMSKDSLLYIEVPSDKDIGFLDNSHDRFMCQHDVIFSQEVLDDMTKKAGYEIIINENFISKRKRNNIRFLLKKR